ncbi:hypothetical protein [Myxococcus sp. AS-1-15]|uniref:hypothetical protein n=1 Tax=Myxococcus sp. AS-1-15 TaxID=2874600 RepID=UPI001CBD897F|nr:hypothetical protein [Myxococcus sp. AS-1-15]MBZ4397134.1 hypothetical protein [Myxococcus sp. AS-1-15]
MREIASCLMMSLLLVSGQVSAEPSVEGGASPREVLTLAVVTCPVGGVQIRYNPPLRDTPQDVRIQGEGVFSNCVTVLGERVTSGTTGTDGVRQGYSCADLLGIVPVPAGQLVWNTGEVSTFRLTQISARVDGPLLVVVQSGTVLSGKFEGAQAVNTIAFAATDLDACRSPEGLPRMSGNQTLVLTKLL